jgi:hypothetical protein
MTVSRKTCLLGICAGWIKTPQIFILKRQNSKSRAELEKLGKILPGLTRNYGNLKKCAHS